MKRCTRCGETKSLEDFYPATGSKANKDGRRPRCKECVKALALADYYRKGPKDPERNREAQRRFRERYPDRDREYGRKWREKNGERANELQRARGQKYRTAKPERHIASQMRRRAKLQAVTREDEDYIAILRGDPCSYCGSYDKGPRGKAVDHIEPLHSGGAVGWENLTAACRSCNASKRAQPLLAFLLRTATQS